MRKNTIYAYNILLLKLFGILKIFKNIKLKRKREFGKAKQHIAFRFCNQALVLQQGVNITKYSIKEKDEISIYCYFSFLFESCIIVLFKQ